MSGVLALITELDLHGIKLRADGEQLRVLAPRGALTPALTERLKTNKGELLALLQQSQTAAAPPPMAPGQRTGPLLLSFAQQRLWFLNRLGSEEAYNIPARIVLQGPLDHHVLEQSLAEIVRRHEILRTTFTTIDGEARQIIHPQAPFALPAVDLAALPAAQRQAEVERLAADEALRPFDLERDLQLRAVLLRLAAPASPQATAGEAEHLLLLTLHHIAGDGWSMEVLLRELGALYGAFVESKPSPLPPLTIQYADFAQWQRQWLAGAVLEQQIAYWQRQLSGAPQLLALPTDRPRPPVQSFQGAKVTFTVSEEVTQALRQISRQSGATIFMTLLAAFKLLLARHTSQNDIVVDTPIAGRNHAEIEPLIGFFVNTLVLRTNLGRASSFVELLGQVRQVVEGAFAHQDAPFEQLVETLRPERSLAFNPLSQVSFALQNRPLQPMTQAGLRIAPPTIEARTVRSDLEMYLFETDGFLSGECVYSTALFDAATIERLVGHYQTLLASIARNPALPLHQLAILPDGERRQLLEWSSGAAAAYPQDRCIHHLFEEVAALSPTAPAVRSALTYQELNARANQLAHHLQRLGVGPESLVGIGLSRSPSMLVAMLGVLKAGGAYIPLDPTYPVDRLRFMLEDAGPKVLLAEAEFLARLAETTLACVQIDMQRDWEMVAQQPAHNPASPVGAENLAYIIYTSGTTGHPKGVQITHRSLVNHANAMLHDYGLGAHDRVLQFAAFSFDVAAEEIFPTWLAGAALVLPPAQRMLGISELLALVEQEGVTILNLPASYWHEWVLQLEHNPVPASVRMVVVGSETVSGVRLARWQAHLAHARAQTGRPTPAWRNAYGLSETTITSTLFAPPAAASSIAESVPIGRPIANTQTFLLDPAGQPSPIGIPGELYIAGDGLARGYLNRPELTAERFVTLDFGAGDVHRAYKTGDRARFLADGNIEFLGRADQQVKIRGFRVEPGAIEAVLAEHPEVTESAIVVHTDASGNNSLVAYVAGQDQEIATHLRRFLHSRMPEYMVPASIILVAELPKLPNGKVDRRSLPAPTAVTADASADHTDVAPRDRTEEIIAAVWREALQIPAVGIHDNFFDLGGHSLLLLRVHYQLQAQLAQPLSIIDIFQYPTVSALAGRLSQARLQAEAAPQPASQPVTQPAASPSPAAQESIAIVGMSCRFPGADSVDAFWRNLSAGVESLLPLDDEVLLAAGVDPDLLQHPHYVKRMGRLSNIDQFDAGFFGYTPREAAATDPQHRIFMECAWEALENAGYAPGADDGRIGVFAGAGANSYRALYLNGNSELARTLGEYQIAVSNEGDAMPTHVSYKLNLTGPSVAINTACSTSLVAVHIASRSLLAGECEMALAGGVTIHAQQAQGYIYEEGMILSPDGHCRAFDALAQGTAAGNGVGVVVLKRLSDALAAGDQIYAVIKGSAINNDGARKVGYTAPSVEGQSQVILAAQTNAQVAPATIGYIETHGTGTPLGDPIEIAALTQAFRHGTQEKGFCAIGAVKTNIGHLDTAAGVAGLIKTALALHYKQIPPSLHFTTPNPHIDFAGSPFYVNTQLADWPETRTPRRAGVSSFGIGGTNAHIILEEAPQRTEMRMAAEANHDRQSHAYLLALSARSITALETATDNLAAHLAAHPELDLQDVAFTLNVGRKVFPFRRIVVCTDTADAVRVLAGGDPQRVLTSDSSQATGSPKATPGKERSVAMLFSGQGSQYTNMGRSLYASAPVFRQIVDHCCDLLLPHLGLDLRSVLFPADPAAAPNAGKPDLNQTAITQPAIFIVEYALARLWESWGVKPAAMLGHSIGEYVAATLAGVFALDDALALVAARGQLMQSLPGGAMLAVSLPEASVRPWLNPDLALAAINGPERCVVAGPHHAIDALETQLAAQGIVCRQLRTSHAFHSQMMEPILAGFAECLAAMQLNPPQRPFVSNVTGRWITAAEAVDPTYWVHHLRQTVRFSDGLALLLSSGGPLLEVGPGNTLSTLANQHPARTASQAILHSLPHPQQAQQVDDWAFLLTTLGRLWLEGTPVDWRGVHAGAACRRTPLPTYPFERQRYWGDVAAGLGSTHAPKSQAAAMLATGAEQAGCFYLPAWRRKPLLPPAAARQHEGAVLIFADASGLGEQLAARLSAAGQPVSVAAAGHAYHHRFAAPGSADIDRYTLHPSDPHSYRLLLDDLQRQSKLPRSILHLWSVMGDHDKDSEVTGNAASHLDQVQERGFYSLLFLAQAWGDITGSPPCHLCVVSDAMQEVAGEPWLDPAKATLLGPVLVIPQEYANLTAQSVDIALPVTERQQALLLDQLCRELTHHDGERLIAYRGLHRWVRQYDPVALPPAEGAGSEHSLANLPLRQEGVYLITGGLGGMGLALAGHLARTVKARLILVGRSAFPPRDDWDNWLQRHAEKNATSRKIRLLQRMEADGAEVLVVRGDVAGMADMQQVLAQAHERFTTIHGVIHAAGAPGAGLIQRKTKEVAAAVLAPKVRGTLVLHHVLQDVALDWLVLCSSLTSVTGGMGQVDYCAANAFLDAFAQARSGRCAGVTVAINWDSWRETGMAVDALARIPSLPEATAGTGSAPAPAGERKDVAHPLFAECWLQGDAQALLISRLCPERDWVLNEHRLLGQATLPATAYLEMARAAFAELHATLDGQAAAPTMPVELRDVFLLQPLTVPDEAAIEVHTRLERTPGRSDLLQSWQFSIRSYSPERGWQEHAVGEIAPLRQPPPDACAVPIVHTLDPIWAAAVADAEAAKANKGWVQSGPITAGPRWQTMQAVQRTGDNLAGAARFALPEPFWDDLADYSLHPALLDGATNYLTMVLGGAYLPFAYQSIRIHRPLAADVTSIMRLTTSAPEADGSCRFDIVVMDQAGLRLVEIEGYTLRRFATAPEPELPPAPEPALLTILDSGLTTAQGVEVFTRALYAALPQVVVSMAELQGEMERANRSDLFTNLPPAQTMASAPGQSNKHPRPASAGAYVAPRSSLEESIAQTWEAFLGITPIGIHDDFFALGGDSLMAIQITSRLSAVLQRKLSPNQFLNAPTVAALADAVTLATGSAGSTGAAPPSPLVNLSPGDVQASPLFLIHPVGGSIYHYRQLAQRLGRENGASGHFRRPVYAIQSPGLDGEAAPLTSVPGMATYYLQIIDQLQPTGPYCLGGWSLGGVVAFEMAQQLRARGEAVQLFMIDTFFPVKPEVPISDAQYAVHFARYMGDVMGKEFNMPVAELERCTPDERVRLIVNAGRELGVLPPELEMQQIAHRLAVYTANFRAMDSYAPAAYDETIFFWASADSIQRSGEALLGWSPLLAASARKGALLAEELPGDHYSIIDSPALIAALDNHLG